MTAGAQQGKKTRGLWAGRRQQQTQQRGADTYPAPPAIKSEGSTREQGQGAPGPDAEGFGLKKAGFSLKFFR